MFACLPWVHEGFQSNANARITLLTICAFANGMVVFLRGLGVIWLVFHGVLFQSTDLFVLAAAAALGLCTANMPMVIYCMKYVQRV